MHYEIQSKSTKQNPLAIYLNMQAVQLVNALSRTIKIH